jgi:hypothetical protein
MTRRVGHVLGSGQRPGSTCQRPVCTLVRAQTAATGIPQLPHSACQIRDATADVRAPPLSWPARRSLSGTASCDWPCCFSRCVIGPRPELRAHSRRSGASPGRWERRPLPHRTGRSARVLGFGAIPPVPRYSGLADRQAGEDAACGSRAPRAASVPRRLPALLRAHLLEHVLRDFQSPPERLSTHSSRHACSMIVPSASSVTFPLGRRNFGLIDESNESSIRDRQA